MGVPEQVRKQTEKVQQLYDDLNPESQTGDAGEETSQAGASSGAGGQKQTPSTNEPVGGDQENTFEQRYRTLQGKYNAEIPALNAHVQELSHRLAQTQQLLSTIQAAPQPEMSRPQSQPISSLTEEERSEYGDSIDVMRKVSSDLLAPYQRRIDELTQTIQQMQGHVLPRVEQVAKRQAESAEGAFWSALASAVPNWQDVNNDPDFHSWLLETDPLTGMTRQTYLEDAQSKLDAPRVASFFTSWLSHPSNTAQTIKPLKASELEQQVAPGRSRSTPAPQGMQKKTYTQRDIADFYRRVSQGAFKGREAERGAIESDIFAAQAEGRIVQA
jgi:hypothetical protein